VRLESCKLKTDPLVLLYRSKIVENLKTLPFAPSVQLQETPRNSLNHKTTLEGAELSDDEDSEIDERISSE